MPLVPPSADDILSKMDPIKVHEAAFATKEAQGRVVSREGFRDRITPVLARSVGNGAPQASLFLGGFSGIGKTSIVKVVREATNTVIGRDPVDLAMDFFMTTERDEKPDSPRSRRLESVDRLIEHFCHESDFERILSAVYEAGLGEKEIPWGIRYGDGVLRDKGILKVGIGKKVPFSEGVLASLIGPPIAKKHGIPHYSIFLYGDPPNTIENAVLRDLQTGRIQAHQEAHRRAERKRELELLLPLMTKAILEADLVVDSRVRLNRRITERKESLRRS